MPSTHLFARNGTTSAMSTTSVSGPIYIAGFSVVGVIVLGLLTWFGLIMYRKRAAAKRERQLGSAFLSIRGVVKESEEGAERGVSLPSGFSRDALTPSIVFPDKAFMAGVPNTRQDVLDFHRQSGTFPKPFTFALSAGNPPRTSISGTGSPNRSSFRSSFLSMSSHSNRFSVMSSNSSFDSNYTTGTTRKVRQIFTPVLPDELLITNLGEQLTLVQSFDDGWCVVGRAGSAFAPARSLFKTNMGPENDVELGVIPAWCFLKPVKGLRAERPIRSTSLGITVHVEGSGFSSRDEIMSWSNF